MTMTPLTKENIAMVIGNLSHESLLEAAVFGFDSSMIKKRFEKFIGQPFTLAFYQDSSPVALIALEPIADKRWQSHFMYIEGLSKSTWRAVTKFLKGFSSEMSIDGYILEAVTPLGRYEKIDKWYKRMGFVCLSITTVGGISTFRYIKSGR